MPPVENNIGELFLMNENGEPVKIGRFSELQSWEIEVDPRIDLKGLYEAKYEGTIELTPESAEQLAELQKKLEKLKVQAQKEGASHKKISRHEEYKRIKISQRNDLGISKRTPQQVGQIEYGDAVKEKPVPFQGRRNTSAATRFQIIEVDDAMNRQGQ